MSHVDFLEKEVTILDCDDPVYIGKDGVVVEFREEEDLVFYRVAFKDENGLHDYLFTSDEFEVKE